jgi:hypothetical protein
MKDEGAREGQCRASSVAASLFLLAHVSGGSGHELKHYPLSTASSRLLLASLSCCSRLWRRTSQLVILGLQEPPCVATKGISMWLVEHAVTSSGKATTGERLTDKLSHRKTCRYAWRSCFSNRAERIVQVVDHRNTVSSLSSVSVIQDVAVPKTERGPTHHSMVRCAPAPFPKVIDNMNFLRKAIL